MHRALLLLPTVALACGVLACGGPDGAQDVEVPVRVDEVTLDRDGNPVIVLREQEGGRALPIWIGLAEARSIASKLEDVTPPRPNTHDLAKRLIDGLDASVERVVVTELREGTYYGRIFMRGHLGVVEIDSRPSDAIALALRVDAPIFVREGLLEETDGDDPVEREPAESGPGREVRHETPEGFPPRQLRAERVASGAQLPAHRTRSTM